MRHLIRFIQWVLLFVLAVSLVSSCVAVKSYERENLADRIMDFDANAEENILEMHFLLTREGSIGGHGGAGGGCACN